MTLIPVLFSLAALLFWGPADALAFGGMIDVLEQIGETEGGDGGQSESTSSSSGHSEPSSPAPSTPVSPEPSGPATPEFGPIETTAIGATPMGGNTGNALLDDVSARIVPAEKTPNMGETVYDSKTGISTTTVTNPDGTKKVTKKDKDGNVLSEEFYPPGGSKPDVVKTRDPETGETTTTVTNKDGSKDVLTTNSEGFLTGETHVPAPRPSASAYDPETGKTTASVKNPDGSRTVTQTDKDGNVISTEIIPPRGQGRPSATMRDPKTGQTTTATRNPDGSRSVVTKDKDGKTISEHQEPPPGKGEAFVSTKDPQTGVTTTVRGTGEDRTVSDSRSWKGDDGSDHTLVTDNKGNQTEIVRDKNGNTTTTQWDKDDRQTQTVQRPDGSRIETSNTADGHIEEKTVNKDGTVETVKKDHAGNVMERSNAGKDGNVFRKVDEQGVTTESRPAPEGGRVDESTDAKGNVRRSYYDEEGELLYQEEDRKTPKESGEAYFENELGGKFGEWDKLPQSAKNQYADSEGQIIERVKAELLRDQQAWERERSEEERRRENAERQKITDEKIAAIQAEADALQARLAENRKKDELLKKRREVAERMRQYDGEIYEALARGDKAEAKRLSDEADALHDSTHDLYKLTPEDENAIADRQAVRDRMAQKVGSRARNIADSNLIGIEGEQELKESVTGKAQYVSIGAHMQEETKKTTRMADREKAFAEAKQAEIYRLLDDPKTTRAEREALAEMLQMADLQHEGASRMLSDNATLTAAGYGIDAAMLLSGGKIAQVIKSGVSGGAAKLAAKNVITQQTAATIVAKTTETGVLKLAGEGVTAAASGTARRVISEEAALATERALTTDVGKVAATSAEAVGTRVIGTKGVETVKNVASAVTEVATTNVSELPGKLGYGRTAATGAAEETAATAAAAPKPAAASAPKPKPAGPQHGDRTMTLEQLEDFAKNPRVRTTERPGTVDKFYDEALQPRSRIPAEDFVKARQKWNNIPEVERRAYDRQVREAIDEAAAMGDKWAKRLQDDLNAGNFNYNYEPGLNGLGLAPGRQTALLNPLTQGTGLQTADRMASTLVHEYAHMYQGPLKFTAQEGGTVAGAATKGQYNEVRAFMAESSFNKNLRAARDLNGKAFDDATGRELDALMGVDNLASKPGTVARGLEARKNLQEGLVDNYEYGTYADKSRSMAAERLSNYRGGSMRDIRERLNKLRGPNGESTPEYEKLLKEIQETGGRTGRGR